MCESKTEVRPRPEGLQHSHIFTAFGLTLKPPRHRQAAGWRTARCSAALYGCHIRETSDRRAGPTKSPCRGAAWRWRGGGVGALFPRRGVELSPFHYSYVSTDYIVLAKGPSSDDRDAGWAYAMAGPTLWSRLRSLTPSNKDGDIEMCEFSRSEGGSEGPAPRTPRDILGQKNEGERG